MKKRVQSRDEKWFGFYCSNYRRYFNTKTRFQVTQIYHLYAYINHIQGHNRGYISSNIRGTILTSCLGAVYPLDLRGGGASCISVKTTLLNIERYLQHMAGVKIPKITMSALVRTDNQSRDGGD